MIGSRATTENIIIVLQQTLRSEPQDFSVEELQLKLNKLYWDSWKCFGLKIAVPMLTLAALFGINYLDPGHPNEVAEVGCFPMMCSMFYSFKKHSQQKEIHQESRRIQEEISRRL